MIAKTHTRRRRHFPTAIEPLESRTLFSTITVTDIESPDDGYQDLIITGSATDVDNNVIVYIDHASNRTIIFDDVNDNLVVNGGVTTLSASPPSTTVTTPAAGGPEVYVMDFVPETINASLGTGIDAFVVQLVSDFAPRFLFPGFNGLSIYADMGSGSGDVFKFSSPTAPNPGALAVNAALIAAIPPLAPMAFPPNGANIDGSDVLIDVNGGSGNDVISADLSRTSIKSSNVVLNLSGGSGSDAINLALPDRILGKTGLTNTIGVPSRVNANIDTGGTGTDALTNTVNLNVRTIVSGGSNIDIDIEGDAGTDIVNANTANANTKPFDFDLVNGKLTVDATLYNGNDRFLALLNFVGLPAVAPGGVVAQAATPAGIGSAAGTLAHFGVSGGFGDDRIDFGNAAPPGSVSKPIAGAFEFDLRGGGNKDEISVHLDSLVSQADSALLLAGGTITVLLNGDSGDDKLEFDTNFLGTGLLDIALMCGSGNDTAVLAIDILPSAVAFVGFRGLLLDGGSGFDSYDIDGNVNAVFALPGFGIVIRGFEQENDLLETNEVPPPPP